MSATKPTIKDVLVALNLFATNVDERFDKIEFHMATKTDLEQLEQKLSNKILKTRLELLTHIDGFVGMNGKTDIEIPPLSAGSRQRTFSVCAGSLHSARALNAWRI